MAHDAYLDDLESRSIYIIREAFREFGSGLALLWSMGKDSTALAHLVRKAFLDEVPLAVVHLDTSFKFKEIYEFRERYAKLWRLNLVVVRNEEALARGMAPDEGRFDCCMALKTEALRSVIAARGLKALLLAIRRDEHSIRAKERYFSVRDGSFAWDYRNQPIELWAQYHSAGGEEGSHLRVHPMLHWQELDIWRYIKREKLAVVDLYFAKGGRRYRSIGCECCCQAVESRAGTVEKIIRELEQTREAERSGRAQDKEKEYMMQKLRSLGYM